MTFDSDLQMHVNANWGAADQLFDFLSDRRLLTDDHVREDVRFCVRSAMEIRSTMTNLMRAATQGPLKKALREIQSTCRNFVDAAGPHGASFDESDSLFRTNLLALRLAMARQVQEISTVFDMALTPQLEDLVRLIDDVRRPGS